MTNVFKWPGVWLNIFKKPDETAALLKKEKPTLVDGIMSYGLACVFIGLLIFLLMAAVTVLGAVSGGNLAASIIGLAMMFAIFVIAFPIGMIILLLIYSAALKVSSMILKGKGAFSQECGIIGVTGSAGIIIAAAMYSIMFVLMFALMAVLNFLGMFAMYPLMGLMYLVIMPVGYLLLAFILDMLASVEQVSIYRAGAIFGLAMGILCCLMMLAMTAFMVFFMGLAGLAMSGMD
jgi:hypothetical protein